MPTPTSFSSLVRAPLVALSLSAVLAAMPAFASGGASSSGAAGSSAAKPSTSPETSESDPADMTTCPKGKVWNVKKKVCVAMHGEILPDDALTDYAYALAKADRYDEAIEVLDMLSNSNTAKALNYRGYATRKLGRTDEGIGYYLRSVALDPAYAQVREYLGEAYVIKGRVDLAKDQLATIKTLCGSDCEEYRDLLEAIEKAPNI